MAAEPKTLPSTRLAQLEEIVEQGIWSAYHALKEIQVSGLYGERYATFEKYIEDRWGYSKSHAYRLIEHVNIIDICKEHGCEVLPNQEGHTRELAKLKRICKTDEEYGQKVGLAWEMVVERAPKRGGDVPQITAKNVESALSHFGFRRSAKRKDFDIETHRNFCLRYGDFLRKLKMDGYEFRDKYGEKAYPHGFDDIAKFIMELAEVKG